MNLASRPYLIISSLVWFSITVFGIYFLFNIKKYVNFGIDLVGGTYLTLDVKVEEAVKNELLSRIDDVTQNLKKKSIALPNSTKINEFEGTASLEFNSEQAAKEAYNLLSVDTNLSTTQKGKLVNFSLNNQFIKTVKDNAVESNISIIRNRLDVFGAGEITIFPQGENSIVVELPNVSDPERAKERIGSSALLEMKPIYDYAKTEEQLLEKLGHTLPEGTMIVKGKTGSIESGYYLVSSYAKVTGRLLKDVNSGFQQRDIFSKSKSSYAVNLKFDSQGAEKFHELTNDNIGHPVAIIIDNTVVSAPVVNEAISSGEAAISGNFEEDSAKELASLLKSGSFVAPVQFVEERQIGPSLGQESIYRGLLSCAIGLGLLFLFSIFVYKTAGLFAFIVLLYNLLFILFGLALIPDATLTLPGIAGMVLTLGMAIDSSILIYEKIKEDLNTGTPLPQAVDNGFNGATSVILDANITTFIVGAVLYYFGSPAIQGFALTMMIGIVSTLITGLILLRWIFNFVINVLKVKRISF